jgi:hypothetical protein
MKKQVFASMVVLAGMGFATVSQLKAQDNVTIKDPAEYNSYQLASTQADPKAKAAAYESFLQAYPQTIVKKLVLHDLVDSYRKAGDNEHTLSAADRYLQLDPNDFGVIYLAVALKKGQCAKTSDAQVCNDLAVLAQKGLTVAKPADASDDEWKKSIASAYPLFHSSIALNDILGKKDVKAAIEEYRTELALYPEEATKVPGPALADTLQLAEAYAKPDARDMVQAAWFYARTWNFAPDTFKAQIEPKLEYWYKRYHGNIEGLDAFKAAAATSLFKPDSVVVKPAPTPADLAHQALTGGDPTKLNLEDKEFVLANGSKEDAEQLWALMKGKETPVPGVVIEASATVIKVAVTEGAKANKIADFIVNLKKPLEEKEIPAAGVEFKLQPAAQLDAVYDTYEATPAAGGREASAQIVLRDGEIVPEKKAAPAATKKAAPAAAHRKAH